jgi:hypothetical protein
MKGGLLQCTAVNGNNDTLKALGGTLDQIDMPVGDGVKGSRINGGLHKIVQLT